MTDDDAQRAARVRAKIMDGIARAEHALFTRPAPKSAREGMPVSASPRRPARTTVLG
ncbi:hypothetical protein ACWGLF_17900 [Streptomyces puniciscabiei]